MKMIALDLGKFKSVCCLFDSNTRKHEFLTVTTDRHYLTAVFKQCNVDLVVIDACGPSGWINDLAFSLGHTTHVCSTNEEACDPDRATSHGHPTQHALPDLQQSWRGTKLEPELTTDRRPKTNQSP